MHKQLGHEDNSVSSTQVEASILPDGNIQIITYLDMGILLKAQEIADPYEAFARSRNRDEKSVRELTGLPIPFETIPRDFFPGKKFVTPSKLVDSGVTAYSLRYILTLIREGKVPGYKLAGKTVLDARGVKVLLDQEKRSSKLGDHAGGRRPGPRRKES